MAAPSSVSIKDLSGKYVMNRTYSDDQESLLSLQGIGWITRKALKISTITLVVKAYEAESIRHIDITSSAGSLSSTHEGRILNWNEVDHKDQVFGEVKGKSRLFEKNKFDNVMTLSEDERNFLLGGTLKNGKESPFLEDDLLQTLAVSVDSGWTVEQVWGFETVDGQRRHTRRIICKKGGKTERIRLVYDYQGPLDG